MNDYNLRSKGNASTSQPQASPPPTLNIPKATTPNSPKVTTPSSEKVSVPKKAPTGKPSTAFKTIIPFNYDIAEPRT